MLSRNNLFEKKLEQKPGFGKRAQIGQTMTWTVATIVILLILLLFVLAAGSENVFKILGAGKQVDDKGSVVMDQQQLFAMLNKDNANLKTLIENEEYREAEEVVKQMLDEFEENEVKCSFSGGKGLDAISAITYHKTTPKNRRGFFADDLIEINGYGIYLECK